MYVKSKFSPMSAAGKSLDITCFLIRAFIIGASSLTLLPTINRQSVSSKPLIFELNKNCDLWLKGILQPSCRHSTDFMFNVSANFFIKYAVSKSIKSPNKKTISSGLFDFKSSVTFESDSFQSLSTNFPLFLIKGVSMRCVNSPSQA